MQTSIYTELLAVARSHDGAFEHGKDELPQVFLSRLVSTISAVDDGVWDGLSEPSQDWHAAAVDAYNTKRELPLPEGFPSEPVPQSKPRRKQLVDVAPAPVAQPATPVVEEATPVQVEPHVEPAPELSVFEDIDNFLGPKVLPTSSETQQEFLEELVRNLHAYQWAPANSAGEAWFETACHELNAVKPITTPPGMPEFAFTSGGESDTETTAEEVVSEPEVAAEPTVEVTAEAQAEAQAEKKARKPRAEKGAAKAPKVKAAAKVKDKKRGTPKSENTVTSTIRRAVNNNEGISISELMVILKEKGLSPTEQTVTSTRASHLAALRSLRLDGLLVPRKSQEHSMAAE